MKTTNPVDRRAHRALALRIAPARHQADVGQVRRAGRQGRLAGRSLPGRAGRSTRWPTVAAAAASSVIWPKHRLPVGKTLYRLRLRGRADGQQGAGDGADRGRQLARKGRQSFVVRPTRRRQEPLGSRHRPRARREWMAPCCSCSPPAISSSACRSHAANSRLKVHSPSSTSILLILDDIVYVSKDQAETSVLFELIGTRYERRSMLITSN